MAASARAPHAGREASRYPTLWEACVNAIVFQQVSLAAASAIMGRFTVGMRSPSNVAAIRLYRFPDLAQVQRAPDRRCAEPASVPASSRRCGGLADALEEGALDEGRMEDFPSPGGRRPASRHQGDRPLDGRRDPAARIRAARRVSHERHQRDAQPALVGGSAPLMSRLCSRSLGPERGMLYYHLLLARLEARRRLMPCRGIRPIGRRGLRSIGQHATDAAGRAASTDAPGAVVASLIWTTRAPRETSTSAIIRRWQRHQSTSAHMTAVRRPQASISSSNRPAANSSLAR